jgi:hypothetical protein
MFSCYKCNKVCASQSGLTLHLKKCISEETLQCLYCNNIFKTKYILNKHIQNKSCQEHRQIALIEEEKENIKIKEHFLLCQEENIKLKQLVKDYEKKINEQEINITKLNENIIKSEQMTQQILNANKDLIQKVGNKIITKNSIVYNLPVLTDEKISEIISPIVFDNKTTNSSEYCKQLSDGGLNKYIFKTDRNRGHVIYNFEGKEIRDDKGKEVCKRIAENPMTEVKIQELKQIRNQLSIQLQYDNLTEEEASEVRDKLHALDKLGIEINKPAQLQKITNNLSHYNSSHEFYLHNYLSELETQIKKNPYSFLFEGPEIYLIQNKYTINHNKLLVKDDKGKEYKLTIEDLRYIIHYLYQNTISFNKPITNEEINAIKTIFTYSKTSQEDVIYFLQKNLSRYHHINEDKDDTNIALQDMLSYISEYNIE